MPKALSGAAAPLTGSDKCLFSEHNWNKERERAAA